MEVKKKGSNRNNNAGKGFERTVMHMLRKIGFEHVVTTRSESRGRDAQGIDLMNKDELKNGRLPYNIQCKNMKERVPYYQLLRDLPCDTGAINVVFHKFTEKKAGGGFHAKGHYAILDMADFLQMAEMLETQRQTLLTIQKEQYEKSFD